MGGAVNMPLTLLACNSDPRVHRVMETVRYDLSRRYSLSELAALVRMSTSGFRSLFSKEIGCSFGRWQRQLRLEAARMLLCTGHLSVKEVTSEVGYQDGSHFVRDFEIAFGQSPSRYRRAHFDRALPARSNPLMD